MYIKTFLFLVVLDSCCAVIYELNDEDYHRMPLLYEFDDYQKCLSRDENLYCLVNVEITGSKNDTLIRMIRDYSEHYIKHFNHTYLERGICVNTSCKKYIKTNNTGDIVNLESALQRCVAEYFDSEYELQTHVTTIHYCHRAHEHDPVGTEDWVFGAVVVLLIAINVVATLYHYSLQHEMENTGNKYLLCFSLISNWKWFVSNEQNDPKMEPFTCIHGIRTLSTIFMLLGHTAVIFGGGIIDNPHDWEKAHETELYKSLYTGTMMVQIFFLISGCLFTYNLSHHVTGEKQSWTILPLVMVYRWFRLSPLVALVLGFTTTWFRHLGSGPLWPFLASANVKQCRQYWWSHLLYVNNYIEDNYLCMLQTWHIAADFWLFAVGLLVYLCTRGNTRILSTWLLFIVGCIGPALHVWYQDLDGVFILHPEIIRTVRSDEFRKMHILTHNNLSCFAMGMLLGMFIFKAYETNMDFTKYKRIMRLTTWLAPFLMIFVCYFGFELHSGTHRPSLLMRMLYAATHRVFFALFLTVLIVAIAFKVEDTYRGILEWKGWRVPSRLSYAVFVGHMTIIQYVQASITKPIHFYPLHMILMLFGILCTSYIIAVPLHLMVETPISRLVKVCLFTNFQKTNNNTETKIKTK